MNWRHGERHVFRSLTATERDIPARGERGSSYNTTARFAFQDLTACALLKKKAKSRATKKDIRPNNTAWALAVACLTSSRASVYDSVLLHLPAIQMLMVLATEQWKKIPGVVTGRASIWSGEPSPGSSFQQDRRLLGGSHAVCAHSGLYRTWQIQIISLFYANNIQHGIKKVAGNSQGQRHYSLHESVW